MTSDPPNLITVPGGRMAEKEAEQAALDLVRAMGEGDIVEGLGKLEMLQALDDMRCDWMEILQHGLPELEKGQAQARTPKLVKQCDSLTSLVAPLLGHSHDLDCLCLLPPTMLCIGCGGRQCYWGGAASIHSTQS